MAKVSTIADTTISIHALLAESDGPRSTRSWLIHIFLSTLSLRRATMRSKDLIANAKFLSTLSLRRATLTVGGTQCRILISIHALLAESDAVDHSFGHGNLISIHALLAESDAAAIAAGVLLYQFLSTLSLRRATQTNGFKAALAQLFLSTLSLRRATALHPGASWPG